MASAPPPWAYVNLRDDRDVDRPAATAPIPAVSDERPAVPAPQRPSSSSKPPGMTSTKDFEFVKELGSGSWSTVMEAVQTATGKRYAVKILSKTQLIKQKKVKYATVEKDALAKLSGSHPGFIKMHAAFQDETSLYFVLDLAPNGDLADLVKKHGSLALPSARWYIAQIVDAVLWMHAQGVLHRDLKPENVLLDGELRVKLSDFGSAYLSPNNDLSPRSSSFVGSAAYVSPELLNRASKTTSSSSDLWAIGCTVYFVIAGVPAFAAINDYQSFRKIEALDYTFPEGFYDTAKDLVQHLLVLDPSERLGVEPKSSPSELRSHPFFTAPDAQTDAHTTPIRWETLWTDPPVPPETGIVAPTRRPGGEDEEEVWENMVQEFSLANIRSPLHVDGDPLAVNGSADPVGPLDVPPGAVPSEVVETVPSGAADGMMTLEPAQESGTLGDDPALRARDWSQILAPGETIRRAVPVKTQIRKGLLKQNRPCTLLLSSQPRLTCVALDEKTGKPKASDVKHSLAFPPTVGKNVIVGCRPGDTPNVLVVQTADKEYTYDFAEEAATRKWIEEINSLVKRS